MVITDSCANRIRPRRAQSDLHDNNKISATANGVRELSDTTQQTTVGHDNCVTHARNISFQKDFLMFFSFFELI